MNDSYINTTCLFELAAVYEDLNELSNENGTFVICELAKRRAI